MTEFSPAIKNVAMEAALSANAVYTHRQELEGQLGRLIELSDMDLAGVVIKPSAETELEERIAQTGNDYKILMKMAGMVTKQADPYDTSPTYKEVPRKHNFITWMKDDSEDIVPAITEENFAAVYAHLHPDANRSRSGIAKRTYHFLNYAADTRVIVHEDVVPTARERIFPEQCFATIKVGAHGQRTYLRADHLDQVAEAVASYGPSIINNFGPKSMATLGEVEAFYTHNRERLFADKPAHLTEESF